VKKNKKSDVLRLINTLGRFGSRGSRVEKYGPIPFPHPLKTKNEIRVIFLFASDATQHHRTTVFSAANRAAIASRG